MTIVSTKQAGLSLIELMISITLGLLLVLGATQVFLSSKNTYSYNEEIGWMQENARFALEQLKRDVRMAGFWGCNTDGDFVSTLNPMPSGNGWQIDFTRAVRGWDGDDAAYPSPEFPGRPGPAVSAGPTVPDSDLLTIRRADDSMGQFNVVGTHNPSSAVIPIDGTHPFQSGDILVVTDCTNTAVFLHHNGGFACEGGKLCPAFDRLGEIFGQRGFTCSGIAKDAQDLFLAGLMPCSNGLNGVFLLARPFYHIKALLQASSIRPRRGRSIGSCHVAL
jgi:hypothetical protein